MKQTIKTSIFSFVLLLCALAISATYTATEQKSLIQSTHAIYKTDTTAHTTINPTSDTPHSSHKKSNLQIFLQKHTAAQLCAGISIGTATATGLYIAEKLLLGDKRPWQFGLPYHQIRVCSWYWIPEFLIRYKIIDKLKYNYLGYVENQRYALKTKKDFLGPISYYYPKFEKYDHSDITTFNKLNCWHFDGFALSLGAHYATWFTYVCLLGYEHGFLRI